MKKFKVLPSVNNIDFCGRVYHEPHISKSGNVMYFDLIRNFGGEKAPVIMSFVMYKQPKDAFPEFLKKGMPVVAHAYVKPVSYEKNGELVEEVQKVIKRVELAELVERVVKDDADAPEETEGDAVEVSED